MSGGMRGGLSGACRHPSGRAGDRARSTCDGRPMSDGRARRRVSGTRSGGRQQNTGHIKERNGAHLEARAREKCPSQVGDAPHSNQAVRPAIDANLAPGQRSGARTRPIGRRPASSATPRRISRNNFLRARPESADRSDVLPPDPPDPPGRMSASARPTLESAGLGDSGRIRFRAIRYRRSTCAARLHSARREPTDNFPTRSRVIRIARHYVFKAKPASTRAP